MKILDRLLFVMETSKEVVRGQIAFVRPYQIVVWMSVGLPDQLDWDSRMPRFPVILDTGLNHNFSIRRGHLARWAGIDFRSLFNLRTMKDRDRVVTLHAATIWLHRNVPCSREPSDAVPVSLKIEEGIGVYSDEEGPRLPLLGLRALALNDLHLTVDAGQRCVHLRSPDFRTKILRILS